MWRIPTATSSALAAVRRQANKAMDPTGLTSTPGRRHSAPAGHRRPVSRTDALDDVAVGW